MKISVNNMSQSKNNGTTYLSPLFCSLILCCFFYFIVSSFLLLPTPKAFQRSDPFLIFLFFPPSSSTYFLFIFLLETGERIRTRRLIVSFFFPPSILSLSDVLFKKPFILLTLVIHKITTDDL